MTISNLFDDVVKGTVSFVFGTVRTLVTLLVHPITGSTRLLAEARDPTREQISSITFLLLTNLVLIGAMSTLDQPSSELERKAFSVTMLVTTGAGGDDFVPLFVGAIFGTLVISSIFRMIALVRGLRGRHGERFRSAMEYQIGFILVCMAATFAVPANLEDDPNVIQAALGFSVGFLFSLSLLSAAAQFWIRLLRSTRFYKFAHPLWRWRHGIGSRRALSARAVAYLRTNIRRLLQPRSLARVLWIIPWGYVVLFAILPVLLITAVGWMASGIMSAWVSTQNLPKATLVALSCDLNSQSPHARALLWNNSRGPVSDWAQDLRLELRLTDERWEEGEFALEWKPAVVGGVGRRTLLPGDFVELAGPVNLTPDALKRFEKAIDATCGAASGVEVIEGPKSRSNVVR